MVGELVDLKILSGCAQQQMRLYSKSISVIAHSSCGRNLLHLVYDDVIYCVMVLKNINDLLVDP
jgi:hypothetical protein